MSPYRLPQGNFAPAGRQYVAFGLFACFGLLIGGLGVWGIFSWYPNLRLVGFSLFYVLFGVFILFFFGTIYLRFIVVTDLFVQISGPLGWRSLRVEIKDIESIRIAGRTSPSPVVEFRLKEKSLSMVVPPTFVKALKDIEQT